MIQSDICMHGASMSSTVLQNIGMGGEMVGSGMDISRRICKRKKWLDHEVMEEKSRWWHQGR